MLTVSQCLGNHRFASSWKRLLNHFWIHFPYSNDWYLACAIIVGNRKTNRILWLIIEVSSFWFKSIHVQFPSLWMITKQAWITKYFNKEVSINLIQGVLIFRSRLCFSSFSLWQHLLTICDCYLFNCSTPTWCFPPTCCFSRTVKWFLKTNIIWNILCGQVCLHCYYFFSTTKLV